MSRYEDFLSTSSMFSGMSALELNAVAAFLEPSRYAAAEIVFKEGDPGTRLYIVLSGTISSSIRDQDGSDRVIGTFRHGDFFGEMAVIEGAPRAATCLAVTDAELLGLDAIDFYRIVYEHPMIGVRMLQAMASVMVGWLSSTSEILDQMVRWGETARKRAITDSLSGLFNKRFIEEALRIRIARGCERGQLFAFMMMDLDGFHGVNSSFGTHAGDAALSLAGAVIGAVVESARPGKEGQKERGAGESVGIVSRLSGDEYAALIDVESEEDAMDLAERVREGVSAIPFEFKTEAGMDPRKARISISVGVAIAGRSTSSADEIMERADKALLQAKREGRDRVVLGRPKGE